MATVESVAREVLAAIDTQAGLLLASRWVADRYRRLASRTRFRHLRKVSALALPAPITAGTVGVTLGSAAVTGDATALAAWSNTVEGWWLRANQAWYEVVEYLGSSGLRLATPYSEATNASASYYLVKRYHALDPMARWLGDFVFVRRRIRLISMALAELDAGTPSRSHIVTGGPSYVSEVGTDASGARLMELYPYAGQAETIAYVYWSHPPTLTYEEQIPPQIDSHVLREGALIDAMRYEASMAARKGQIEAAAYWRNEYRAQAVSWEREVLDAIRADRGSDDLMFILETLGGPAGSPDIRTARDVVLDRWPL